MKKFRKGAASFYIVSFSTLILVIIAASFATIIISEVTRASNDDLSQSAYDAALAGVEDAKIAYSNYRRCIEINPNTEPLDPRLDTDTPLSCGNIIWIMQNSDISGCDMVALMIGRITKREWVDGTVKEVLVSDTITSEGDDKVRDLNQAYTCVKIGTELSDYRANLTSSSNYRLVRVGLADGVDASQIESVKISWYSVRDGQKYNFANFLINGTNSRVAFRRANDTIQPATPPTIEVMMVQTEDDGENGFLLSDLNSASQGKTTDRATLFLVPIGSNDNIINDEQAKVYASSSVEGNYKGTYDRNKDTNLILDDDVVKTNDQSISNLPFVVYCRNEADFMCEATVKLPKPIGNGSRNDNTFMFLVTLPYGQPDTDFAMQFLCGDGVRCSSTKGMNDEITWSNVARISGVQVVIDSTGRANDLFRRVETRLEPVDVSFPYTYYALQLVNNDGGATLKKELIVTSEHDRYYY